MYYILPWIAGFLWVLLRRGRVGGVVHSGCDTQRRYISLKLLPSVIEKLWRYLHGYKLPYSLLTQTELVTGGVSLPTGHVNVHSGPD